MFNHLIPDTKEAEAIYIIRETAAQFNRPVLLFSGGKDSLVLVELARRAFYPMPVPFPLLHIDTGHNFPETLEFRDQLVKKFNLELIVVKVQDSIDAGLVTEEKGAMASRNALQGPVLLDAIERYGFDACLGGARRDEEKARAKERIFSIRNAFGQWDSRQQRPELFDLLNGKIEPGSNVRVFPISNWTELDVWRYIERHHLDLPDLYFACERDVVRWQGQWMPGTEAMQKIAGSSSQRVKVRYRTIGDMSCTAAVESEANSIAAIISEIEVSAHSERGSRMDDQRSDNAMEQRKQAGYF